MSYEPRDSTTHNKGLDIITLPNFDPRLKSKLAKAILIQVMDHKILKILTTIMYFSYTMTLCISFKKKLST